MTKFRLFSDNHYYYNKHYNEEYTDEMFSKLNDGFDGVNLIAGDVGSSPNEVKEFCYKYIPNQRAIIIGGNHFMYGFQASYEDLNKEYKKVLGEYDCLGSGNLIVFANRDDYSCQKTEDDFDIHAPIVFGATLWTNFMSDGVDKQEEAMRAAEYGVSDFRFTYVIPGSTYRGVIMSPYDMWKEFEHTLADIKIAYVRAMQKGRKFILMTHFPVTPESTAEEFKGSPLNPYFCNDLRKWIIENIPNTAFILQGHQHNRWQGKIEDKEKGVSIPIYQNPFGYITQNETYAEPEWNPNLIVEVE